MKNCVINILSKCLVADENLKKNLEKGNVCISERHLKKKKKNENLHIEFTSIPYLQLAN